MKRIKTVPVTKEVVREVVTEEKDEVVEEEGGLTCLLGKNVCFMCMSYFYYGKLIGVNSTYVVLEDAGIVYDTGDWNNKSFSDFQKVPTKELNLLISSIESFFEINK